MDEVPAWALVRTTADPGRAETWSFALHALGIVHRVDPLPATAETNVSDGVGASNGGGPGASSGGWGVWVPALAVARATAALDAQDREEREQPDPRALVVPDQGRSFAGLAVAVGLAAFFAVTGPRDGADAGGWFRGGSAVAERIVQGQWWRAVTALTLHADLSHVAGNAVACVIFVTPLGRWLGDGLALLLVLLTGALGNLATAYLFGAGHDSVGASTATFGALGLLGGLQIVRWLRGRSRLAGGRRRAVVVLAACLGLFAMLGVGPRSDVVAHLCGLVVGLVLGMGAGVAVGAGTWFARAWYWPLQVGLLAASAGVVVRAWALALR